MGKSICIVSSQCLPHIGGIEQYIDNFSRELVRQGNKVTILTSELDGVPDHEKEGDWEIYRLPSFPFMNGRFPVLKYNRKLRNFTKKFKKKKFDIMLVNMRFYFISLYAVRLAKKMNLRCMMLDHGTSHLNTGGKFTSKLGEWFEHWITWMERRYCKEFAFEQMKAMSVRNFREEYRIPKDAVVISFVGRVTIEKGIRELVHVVNKICRKRDDVYLLAAGKGYLEEELKEIACDHVHLTGQMPLQDVVSMLQASDIFCLPSVSEGFPTCVLEASLCDNYVVTTYRGGAKECITGREYGMILPDNNEKGLYTALMKVLDEEEYRRTAAKRCKERVAAHYTWEQTAKTFLALLEE